MITLTDNEILELTYMQKLGYKYIARDDNYECFVYAYFNKPFRNDNNTWIDKTTDYICCKLGKYNFLSWNDEPMSIDKLLSDTIKPIELVYPNNED